MTSISNSCVIARNWAEVGLTLFRAGGPLTLARTCYFPILERTWGGGATPACHFAPN